ncbi:hypothetical protein EVA_18428 [gut metagenome]|uniref:Uncharacterized protein n=1 Tax=gut metagenome TaxID=749906 RepID=J9G1K7_9ZZZZ
MKALHNGRMFREPDRRNGYPYLCSILNDRNAILVGYCHDFINLIRHTIKCDCDYCLRIFSCLLLPVKDCLFKQYRIHIPGLTLRTDKNRLCTKIRDRM